MPEPPFFKGNKNDEKAGLSKKPEAGSSIDTFVALLPMEWKTYHRRPHWQSQAEISNILCIDPPAGLLVFRMHFNRIKDFIRRPFGLRRGDNGIMFFRPLSLVTYGVGYRIKLFSIIDRLIIKYQLRYIVRKLGIDMKRMAYVIANNHQYYLAGVFPEMITCYEVTDEYSAVPGETQIDSNSRKYRMSSKTNKQLLSIADIVITSSQPLYNKYSGVCPHTYYLPNGADIDHFSSARSDDLTIPPDLETVAAPRIGYIGSIINTFDFDLLYKLAAARKDWSFVIVGRVTVSDKIKRSEAFQEVHKLSNVHFLGFRDYETLPAYLKGLDVCLLPHKLCEWMRYSCPNKVFQYLSAGKPVVSTDFESIRELKDVVYIAGNADKFLEYVTRSLDNNDEAARGKRIEVAQRNSTQTRAKLNLKLFSDLADKIHLPS